MICPDCRGWGIVPCLCGCGSTLDWGPGECGAAECPTCHDWEAEA
jgi:hypothetical protein